MIPGPVQAVLDFFETHLHDQQFGDISAASLSRYVTEIQVLSEHVAHAESVLAAARAALLERQEALHHDAQRALAYARIFAECNESLSRQLDTIALGRPAKRTRGAEACSSEPLVLTPGPGAASAPSTRQPRTRTRPRHPQPAPSPDHAPPAATDACESHDARAASSLNLAPSALETRTVATDFDDLHDASFYPSADIESNAEISALTAPN